MRNTSSVMKLNPVLTHEKLVTLLGGTAHQRFSYALNTRVQTTKNEFNRLIRPRLNYRTLTTTSKDNGLVSVGESITFESRTLAKALNNCEKTVCFVATIGAAIDEEINRLMRNRRLSEAYILDAMGSAAVEDLVDRFQQEMESNHMEEGKTVTLRFSPGYCDWSITEQKKLFRILEPEKIGVRLLDSCLMQPSKSISGIFGIAPNEGPPYNPCLECPKKDCDARRL